MSKLLDDRRLPLAAAILVALSSPAFAQDVPSSPDTIVTASTIILLGKANTSSQGSISRQELQ
jgi:hypothetical protein